VVFRSRSTSGRQQPTSSPPCTCWLRRDTYDKTNRDGEIEKRKSYEVVADEIQYLTRLRAAGSKRLYRRQGSEVDARASAILDR
jgi:hypothetical protein